jgi:hypothetical protein
MSSLPCLSVDPETLKENLSSLTLATLQNAMSHLVLAVRYDAHKHLSFETVLVDHFRATWCSLDSVGTPDLADEATTILSTHE